jgi:hypothetical protein
MMKKFRNYIAGHSGLVISNITEIIGMYSIHLKITTKEFLYFFSYFCVQKEGTTVESPL